jgi:hypothetical protein
MKRTQVVLLAVASCLCFASTMSAQFGVDIFKKPNIADIFKPVVGNGALYEQQRGQKITNQMEMTIVAKELVDGQQGYWMEIGHKDDKSEQMTYAKVLVTGDFQMRKVVIQQPGGPAMELPYNPNDKTKSRMNEEMEKWHTVGTESVSVPAGTFLCQHWKKDAGNGDVWVNDKVSPFTMVKSVSSDDNIVLLKTITGASDHITGPVTKFDPAMLQRLMQQRQPQ